MTAQAPDEVINEHPSIKLDGMYLYGIIRGDPTENNGWGDKFSYATPPSPPEHLPINTACWRGYIATHRLAADGTFHIIEFRFLTKFEYDESDKLVEQHETQRVNERIDGDFWLVFKPSFSAARMYVPFCNGKVVEERSEWFFEEPRADGYDIF